ncbi:hypothetical protein ACFV5N_11805 [Streptomyces sp. NPDC059853]|uniref:hypothetical protein n=1 Tax=Streptomyces sp. NPDC059853 TaxID=3346973 RepID=UPI00366737E4
MHPRVARAAETVRNRTGRLATVVGAGGLAASLLTGEMVGVTVLATVTATGAGLVTVGLKEADRAVRGIAAALYATPGVTLLGILTAVRLVDGVHLWEVAAVAGWAAATWWLRPARAARELLAERIELPVPEEVLEAEPEQQLVVEQVPETHPLARWWQEQIAAEGGVAPHTRLVDPQQVGPGAMRAVITSTIPGEPVPDISIPRLSARMDFPADQIRIGPVPGRGAGVQLLTVGDAPAPVLDPAQAAAREWEAIAAAAMPGTALVDITTYPTAEKEIEK